MRHPTLPAAPHAIRADNRTVARVMTRVSRGKRASAGDAVTRPSGAGTFGSLRHRPLPQCAFPSTFNESLRHELVPVTVRTSSDGAISLPVKWRMGEWIERAKRRRSGHDPCCRYDRPMSDPERPYDIASGSRKTAAAG